ncbi:ATP-binding protein [Candidatus Woesearchaeota archaeon]|nr:ATP-binding protein [Candidatus Woesearchaeota archaeon]
MLGRIIDKTTTTEFKISLEQPARKLDYIKIEHKEQGMILAQILEIEKNKEQTIAICTVLGFRDKNKILKSLRTPLEPNSEVYKADENLIKTVLGLEHAPNSAFIGTLDGYDNIKVYLDLNKLITKHCSILAKSGSGKSYASSVLLEELLLRNIPIVVIDPHGEYQSLKFPNTEGKEKLLKFNLKPNSFLNKIQEFSSDTSINPGCLPLKLPNNGLTASELLHLLPTNLSSNQQGILYSALKHMKHIDFDNLIFQLEQEESSAKFTLINIIEYVRSLELFSDEPTLPKDLVKSSKASIINLRGTPPEVQEVIVYKLARDLFMERKKNNIPPFFLVVEEAQNFSPERNFGEAKSSVILRQIASEGRKFGLGLCIISQRSARVDKNVLSQCSTQIILKITNPNDLKTISSSLEGINSQTEKEVQSLSIGTAMVVGVVDLPLFVNIRPRLTKHGGEAISILQENSIEEDVYNKNNEALLPIIKPKLSLQDIKVLNPGKEIKTKLIPASLLVTDSCSILLNLNNGEIVTNLEEGNGFSLQSLALSPLSPQQKAVLNLALTLKKFKASDIFSKAKIQFSELYDTIHALHQKGYIKRMNEHYEISETMDKILNIKEVSFTGKIDYTNVTYDEMLEKNFEPEDSLKELKNYLNIKEKKDCNLVIYEIK